LRLSRPWLWKVHASQMMEKIKESKREGKRDEEKITRCSPLKVNRRFRGTYCLYLQGRSKGQARNSATCFHDGFLFGLFLRLSLDSILLAMKTRSFLGSQGCR
jgi:hypothetical protein